MSSPELSRLTIRKSLLLWLLIPLVCLCTLSGFVAFRLSEKFANESYDMLLLRAADSIAARLTRNESGVVVADLPVAAQAILRHGERDKFYYQIADSYGHRLTGDSVLPLPVNVDDKGPKFRYAVIDGQTVRVCRVSVQISPSPDEIWVQVAETLNSRQRLLEHIFISIVAPQLMLVALASLSVWLGVTFGLAPLNRLGQLLNARESLDLSPIDIGKTPAELAPVIKALNELFLSANDHIRRQRQFIGNAAHQLRTPVTSLQTYVDHARRMRDTSPERVDQILQQMSEATRRLAHLVSRLLSLARTEETGAKTLEIIDLNRAIKDAAANVVHEALNRGILMEFEIPETEVKVRADRGDLAEMITNLLENAIRYNRKNGSIWVKVETDDKVRLRVEDDGPGIADVEKAKVFERFYRTPGTNEPGCGLGLAIVAEFASTNHARVEILDRPGGGTVFQVAFARAGK